MITSASRLQKGHVTLHQLAPVYKVCHWFNLNVARCFFLNGTFEAVKLILVIRKHCDWLNDTFSFTKFHVDYIAVVILLEYCIIGVKPNLLTHSNYKDVKVSVKKAMTLYFNFIKNEMMPFYLYSSVYCFLFRKDIKELLVPRKTIIYISK